MFPVLRIRLAKLLTRAFMEQSYLCNSWGHIAVHSQGMASSAFTCWYLDVRGTPKTRLACSCTPRYFGIKGASIDMPGLA